MSFARALIIKWGVGMHSMEYPYKYGPNCGPFLEVESENRWFPPCIKIQVIP